MGFSVHDIDSIEFAQDLQLTLMEESDLVRRVLLANEAIRLLRQEAQSEHLYGRRLMLDGNLALRSLPKEEGVGEAGVMSWDHVAVDGLFHGFYYIQLGGLRRERPVVMSLCVGVADATLLTEDSDLHTGEIVQMPVLAITQKLVA